MQEKHSTEIAFAGESAVARGDIAAAKAEIALAVDVLQASRHLAISMFAVVKARGSSRMELRLIDVDQDAGTRAFDSALIRNGLSAYASDDVRYAPFAESLDVRGTIGVLPLVDVASAQASASAGDGGKGSPICDFVGEVRGSKSAYVSGAIPPLEECDMERVVGLVFAYSCSGMPEPLFAYQRVQPSAVMEQSRFLYKVTGRSRFKLFTEASIKIGTSFDFLIARDALLVMKPSTIETQFSYQEVLRRNAGVVVEEIGHLVDGADIINAKVAADRRRVVRKLIRIGSSPVKRMSASELRVRLESEELYRGAFQFGPDDRVVVEEDNVEFVLKMLDDELLRSPLTDVVYESEIKSQYRRSKADEK